MTAAAESVRLANIRQRALIEQQATQIAMADHAYQLLAGAHEQQAKEIARLREALSELYAQVKGECPSLLNEDSGGDAKLDLEIESLLKEELAK